MMDDRSKILSATSMASISNYLDDVSKLSKKEEISSTIAQITRQAKKLSAADHRQFLMEKASEVGTEVDDLEADLDRLIADRRAYNEYLQKRNEIWSEAGNRVQRIVNKPSLDLSKASSSSSMSSSKLNIGNISSQTAESSLQSFVNASNNSSLAQKSMTGDTSSISAASNISSYEGRATENVTSSLPKPPELSDYQFSSVAMELLRNKESSKSAEANNMKPPTLDCYQFSSLSIGCKAGGDTNQSVQLMKPPELPSFNYRTHNQKPHELARGDAPSSFEKHEIDAHRASSSSIENGTKKQKSSLTGSFLDENPIHHGFLPHARVVRSDLGFGESTLDDSVSIVSSITNPSAHKSTKVEEFEISDLDSVQNSTMSKSGR